MASRHLVYRITCPALTAVSEVESASISGVIKSAYIHMPKNTASLVEIEIWLRTEKILPDTRIGIVGDDMRERFSIGKPCNIGDDIKVIVKNHDDTYEHTIVVIIELEETEGGKVVVVR